MDTSVEENGNIDDNNIDTNEDTLTKTIGEFGRWQKCFLWLVVVPTKVTALWTLLSIVFFAPKTTFRCMERSNSSFEIVNSTCYSDCVEYEYYSEFENTIISEWNLICRREWLANLSQTVCVFGVFVGCLFYGFTADRYGRRPTFFVAVIQKILVNIIMPFSPTLWIFMVFRFIDGLSAAGIMFAPYIILIETTSPRLREEVNIYIFVGAVTGQITLPLFAYYLRSWHTLILGLSVPHLLFLSYFFVTSESPKWLLSVGKIEEAKIVMRRAAKFNGLPTEQISQAAERIYKEGTASTPKVKATYLDLFFKPSLRVKNLLSCITWFLIGLNYYGSNQYIGQTSKNAFLTVMLAGALQMPGILLGMYWCKKFGRRIALIVVFMVSAVSNAMLSAPDHWFYFKLVVGTIGVGAAGASYGIIYMYTSELFPTVTRNMALGSSSTASRLGSMVAPFAAGLAASSRLLPPTIFTLAPLLAAVASYFLPETRGIQLMDHIED